MVFQCLEWHPGANYCWWMKGILLRSFLFFFADVFSRCSTCLLKPRFFFFLPTLPSRDSFGVKRLHFPRKNNTFLFHLFILLSFLQSSLYLFFLNFFCSLDVCFQAANCQHSLFWLLCSVCVYTGVEFKLCKCWSKWAIVVFSLWLSFFFLTLTIQIDRFYPCVLLVELFFIWYDVYL